MTKQLKLLSLSLKNFKGVVDFKLDVQGANAKVFGDNATGKTTLFDAFIYLLFDKDSQNKKDFSLKTLDAAGNELHMLEHEVEGVFLLDGQQLTLKKVYSENWTKKRGSATAEFSGHTTKYAIDGVPSKLKEYKTLVDSIVNEEIFKQVTSPSYFNEQLKWQDRRKTLLEISGDISDEEVIASDKSLAKLPSILQGRTIENHRKVIASKRTEINKELEKIPVRIDEIKRGIPVIEGLDKQVLESDISILNGHIDDKMTQISNIKNGKSISDKQMAIQKIEMELLDIGRNHDSDSKELVYQLKAKLQEERSNVSLLTSKVSNIESDKRNNDENINHIDFNLQQLRQEWQKVNSQEFVHNDACECPTCGQVLPEEQVTSAQEKALAQFNLKKSENLEDINAKGKERSERKQEITQENEKLVQEYEKLNSQIIEKQTSIAKLEDQLKQQESLVTDLLDNPAYVTKLKEKQGLEVEIKSIRDMSEGAIRDIQIEIIDLKQKRDQLQGDVAKFTVVDQSNQRVEELSNQERGLASEFEKLEQELYLTEEFIRTKVNLLEGKINSKFKYATFKLFKENINGGLEETCEALFEGVPYSSGLNNAAKINVGLDIINTLSEYYGFLAPIFIDNSEAVTKLIDTNTQTISLVVSESDKQLRVETDDDYLLLVDCEVIV